MGRRTCSATSASRRWPSRGEHRAEVDAAVRAWTATLDKLARWAPSARPGCPAGALRSTTEVLNDADLRQRGIFVTVDDPGRGKVTIPAYPVTMSRSRVRVAGAPAARAAHRRGAAGVAQRRRRGGRVLPRTHIAGARTARRDQARGRDRRHRADRVRQGAAGHRLGAGHRGDPGRPGRCRARPEGRGRPVPLRAAVRDRQRTAAGPRPRHRRAHVLRRVAPRRRGPRRGHRARRRRGRGAAARAPSSSTARSASPRAAAASGPTAAARAEPEPAPASTRTRTSWWPRRTTVRLPGRPGWCRRPASCSACRREVRHRSTASPTRTSPRPLAPSPSPSGDTPTTTPAR